MRFKPEQPLPTWAEAKPDLDAYKPLWPIGRPPVNPAHVTPTSRYHVTGINSPKE